MNGRPARLGADPIDVADVIELIGDRAVFAPGHHLRSVRCLVCAEMIGGRETRIHTLTDTRQPACDCGGLSGTIFVVCAAHDFRDDDTLMRLALDRASRHHDGQP